MEGDQPSQEPRQESPRMYIHPLWLHVLKWFWSFLRDRFRIGNFISYNAQPED